MLKHVADKLKRSLDEPKNNKEKRKDNKPEEAEESDNDIGCASFAPWSPYGQGLV